MSKYCTVCGKEKEWANPFIEGEPLECDECLLKVNKQLTKLILKQKRNSSIIIPKNGCIKIGYE